MPERMVPDAIVASTNLTGTVTQIQDDPDAPDTAWLTRTSANVSTDLRVSFPTPSQALDTGTVQEARVLVRSTGEATSPTVTVELWEAGALVTTLVPATSLTAQIVHSGTFDKASLVDQTGAGVEIRVIGTVGGGKTTNRATVEVGAVEWNAVTAAPSLTLAGVSAGSSTAVAALGLILALSGASVADSTSTGSLSAVVPIAGTSAGSSTSGGALSTTLVLSGAAEGTSTSTGALTVTAPALSLAGTAVGASSATGALSPTYALSGTAISSSTSAGAMTVTTPASGLVGLSTASSTASGALSLFLPLSGAHSGSGSATGALTIAGDAVVIGGPPPRIVYAGSSGVSISVVRRG